MNIEQLVSQLRLQGKQILADCIDMSATMTLLQYSRYIWSRPAPNIAIEPALEIAFRTEFTRIGIPLPIQDDAIASLHRYRILHTAPHTGLCESPRLLTMLSVGSVGMPDDAYLIVPTFSGIPFGNDSYPGALSVGSDHLLVDMVQEQSPLLRTLQRRDNDRRRDTGDTGFSRISMIPKSYRDMLVYRSTIPETFWNIWDELSDPLRVLMTYDDRIALQSGADFTRCMAVIGQRAVSQSLQNNRILYVDGNEVITNYLLQVLLDDTHVITQMFFDTTIHARIMETWGKDTHFFYDAVVRGDTEIQTHAYIDDLVLKHKYHERPITRDILIDLLRTTKLSPGVFMMFTVCSFLNGLHCIGGFKQVGYLSGFKQTWQDSGLLPHDISGVHTDLLATGLVPGHSGNPVTPIDIILGSDWNPDPSQFMADLYHRVSDVLTGFRL